MANQRKKPAKKNTRSRSTPRRTSSRKKSAHKKSYRKKSVHAARHRRRRKPVDRSLLANRWVQAALALVIVGALVATVLTLGGRHRRVTYDFGTDDPYVEGVDISEHNGTVDWATLAKSAKFAFIRVGYRGYTDGALHADKMAKENLKAARKAGVPVGAYFFSQATTVEEAKEEARFVLEAVRFSKVELPLIIDYEYGYNAAGEHAGRLHRANVNKKDTTRLLAAFCDTVTADGYTAGVYANSHFYISKFDAGSLPKGTLRWVADYNGAVTYTGDFDIWQYSKTGKIKGNGSKYIDLNRWYLGGS